MTKRTLCLILLLTAMTARSAHAQITAIKAGKLIDPETGITVLNQIILIEGKVIKSVGAGIQIPASATVIDLSTMTVMPGLFDCHTHMCMGVVSGRGIDRKIVRYILDSYFIGNSTGYRAIQGVANARAMLEAGFTTIRDIGNAGNYADTDLRRAIEEGIVPGPTVINAGRIIGPFGGQFFSSDNGYTVTPERPEIAGPEYFFADTRDELKKAIHENIFYGSKVIKIVVDAQPHIYSVEDIRFVIEESRRAGLKVAAHCGTDAGARNAAMAGVASIEHGSRMSDETLELAKKNNVVLVGTDFNYHYWLEYGFTEEIARRVYDRGLDRIRRADRIGTPMAFGADIIYDSSGKSRGELSLSLIESYLDAGLSSKSILQMLTINAARLLGVDNDRGAIKPGLAADLIATPENPLDNIQSLKQVRFVMKEGKVFKKNQMVY